MPLLEDDKVQSTNSEVLPTEVETIPDAYSEGPIDFTNQMISSPYMGNAPKLSNPDKLLKSPDASLEEKSQAINLLQQKQAEKDAIKAYEAEKVVADKARAFSAWQVANEKYDKVAEQAKALGKETVLPSRPDPSKFGLDVTDIAHLSNPKTQQEIAPTLQSEQVQNQKQQELVQQQNEVLAGRRQAAAEQNNQLGFLAQQNEISRRLKESYDASLKTVDDEQYKLDKINPNKFWDSLSSGQKIMGNIALALGAIGGALTRTNDNVAADLINKAIDRDIEAQKISNENKLSLKQQALKRSAMEIDKFEAMSKDNERKFQMKMISDQLKQQAEALRQQQAQTLTVNKQLHGEGIPPDQADLLIKDADRTRTLVLPNGNVTLAVNKEAADKANQYLTDVKGAKGMLAGLKQDAVGLTTVDKLNPFSSRRGAINTQMEGLIGKLRLPITGPGILNEKEYERLRETVLGDPTSLMNTKGLFEARVNALEKLLNAGARATYDQAGVKLPMNNADKLRQKLYKSGLAPEAVEAGIEAAKRKQPNIQGGWE